MIKWSQLLIRCHRRCLLWHSKISFYYILFGCWHWKSSPIGIRKIKAGEILDELGTIRRAIEKSLDPGWKLCTKKKRSQNYAGLPIIVDITYISIWRPSENFGPGKMPFPLPGFQYCRQYSFCEALKSVRGEKALISNLESMRSWEVLSCLTERIEVEEASVNTQKIQPSAREHPLELLSWKTWGGDYCSLLRR